MKKVCKISFGVDENGNYGPVGEFYDGFGCASLKQHPKDLIRRFEEDLSFIDSLLIRTTYKILIPYEFL